MKETKIINDKKVWNYVTINDMACEFWGDFTETAVKKFNGSYAKEIEHNYKFVQEIIPIFSNLSSQIEDLKLELREIRFRLSQTETFINDNTLNFNDTVVSEDRK